MNSAEDPLGRTMRRSSLAYEGSSPDTLLSLIRDVSLRVMMGWGHRNHSLIIFDA